MKRRTFLRNLSLAAGGQMMLNGASIQLLKSEPMLNKYAQLSINDNILVIVQLHGGNDGLNTVIPVDQYDKYYNFRPNLAISQTGPRKFISLDNTLTDRLVGFHPDMTGMKEMYDQGHLAVLQNVGYANMNGSHFKSRDIWFGGVGSDTERISSGWIGRYLQDAYQQNEGKIFPDDFPQNSNMKDPLALEFSGGDISLGFHTESTIPTAISIPDVEGFFGLVTKQDGYNEEENSFPIDERGIPPVEQYNPANQPPQNTLYGEELNWILKIEKGTDKYAERLKKIYDSKSLGSVSYPTTYPLGTTSDFDGGLSNSLKVIARLVEGGCKTKVYLVRLGGFDTHVNQVEHYDNSIGHHASLLYNISASMKAFYDDLKSRGIDNRVLSVTMSEFGRRAVSNNSYGSDHGTMAPMFVYGTKINPGVIGKNPDLSKVNSYGGNIADGKEDIIDHRVVFSTILQGWFGVDKPKIQGLVFPTLKSGSSG